MSASPQLPARARVVIIGGGIVGASIAYHLAHEGVTDVVLLERDRLTSGTTWHAAGLMTCFGPTSETQTSLRLYTRDLYARLEAETGLATGFRPVGVIEAVTDEVRLEEYRRVAAFQRTFGLEVHEIGPVEVAERFPIARTDDVLAGFLVPGDGRVNPVDVTMSLARGARQLGVRIVEGCPVADVLTAPGVAMPHVTGVRTAFGDIECDVVVNAAGMWARQLAERSGVVVPNQAAEHSYLITEPMGIDPTWPVFEDPSAFGYYREEGGGLMLGLFEPEAAAWSLDAIPEDFSFGQIAQDWDRLTEPLQAAMARIPLLENVGVKTFFCGPESFTPDRRPAIGEAPGVRGYFVAAGLNSVGILSGGGLGRIVAHWIATGRPDVDITGFDVARFRDFELRQDFRSARTAEILGKTYAVHPPGTQLHTRRGVRVSPVHERLIEAGAWLRDVSGMESPDWYAGVGQVPHAEPSWGRQPWFVQWAAEHEAVREAAGLFDMSFMAVFDVVGPGAAGMLERMSCAAVGERDGRITYTQWLTPEALIDADVTVIRLSQNQFRVVSSDTAQAHVHGLLRRGIEDLAEASVEVRDVTDDVAMFSLQGPHSREVLMDATDGDVAVLSAMRFRDIATTRIAGVDVLVARMSYVGELGFELYPATKDALAVWDALVHAGHGHGLRLTGLAALHSLRLEKGYRDWGHDLDNTDSLPAAGLEFTVSLDKPGGFVGRQAYLEQVARGIPTGRIVRVQISDPQVLLFDAEVLLRDGMPVGYLRSSSYGWSVGAAVALGFVEAEVPVTDAWIADGSWEVDVAGRRHRAQVFR